MFSGLFDEEEDPSSTNHQDLISSGWKVERPPPLRPTHGFCGIQNQGATCYLNSLLQTLFLTPEFRDGLFSLGPDQLGQIENKDNAECKVRIIPVQLQRLFIQMLHINQAYVSTTDLTDSFGWTDNEELQQHDVQELNRILFMAIEESLVGTSGQNLIKNLYHGTTVNQIICQECGKLSEVTENFLDITLTVSGNIGLENSLYNSYIEEERLEGNNQYRCSACDKLVNARRRAKVRHLPPILTFSLLRFSYNFEKMERYKENGKFSFPLSLDMSRYLEHDATDINTDYELFSVVIHGGSAHGGHYHAYIRDVEGLGNWVPPEEEQIVIPRNLECDSHDQVDLIQLDSPRNVIKALLDNTKDKAMSVDYLCTELVKQTGVSWNKRFKKSHGTIHKFLQRHDDIFLYDESTKSVALKDDLHQISSGCNYSKLSPGGSTCGGRPQNKESHPMMQHCWFDFNDAHVHPIWTSDIENQFSGKESGYMLFYRAKSDPVENSRSSASERRPIHWKLLEEVDLANQILAMKRLEHDQSINQIELLVLEADHYHFNYPHGALREVDGCPEPRRLKIDRRKSMRELRQSIRQELGIDDFAIHLAKKLPAGIHLYHEISSDSAVTIQGAGMVNQSLLFVWNGSKVQDEVIPIGEDCEPILLTFTEDSDVSWSRGFPKNLPLGVLRSLIAEITIGEGLELHRLDVTGNSTTTHHIAHDHDNQTLDDLRFQNGSQIVLNRTQGFSNTDQAEGMLQDVLTLKIENRCQGAGDADWPIIQIQVKRKGVRLH